VMDYTASMARAQAGHGVTGVIPAGTGAGYALLSVNPHHNGQKFTDKSLGNAGLSVKCVLITDKSSKTAALSVNLNEILDKLVEQYCI
ncbi:hypothetical protein, partial [Ligilactobacillus ruminis]|uniref:hypothetical protein n=1 Tax=Ligilactobacillus ruminis TaxID=1623 RepID=UPI00325A4EFB